MLGARDLSMEDYVAMLRRHVWLIAIPALLGPLVGFGVSLILPPQYTSTTLVLVEDKKIPDKIVQSLITDTLPERLGTMKEQILSRTRLQPIIENNNLYKSDSKQLPMEDLVAKMRKAIVVAPVQSTVAKSSGVPGFQIAFTYSDPQTAQLVCQQITTLFMDENLKQRDKTAATTTEFLGSQLDEAKKKLDEQDARLADFKRRNIGQLPGQEGASLQLLMASNAQLEATTQTLNRTTQDKAYAESQLALAIAASGSSQSGTNPQALDQQLSVLQNQLLGLQGRYTDVHPDIIKLKGDIAQLKAKIEEVNNAVKTAPAEKPQTASLIEPPQVQQLRNQIRLLDQTIQEKTREQQRLQKSMNQLQARVQLSPVVEEEYKKLTRDYGIALGFYNELLSKKTTSDMSRQLENQQQGEQFRVIDPANLPAAPTFPNRPLFAAGGLGAGLALGLGLTLLMELKDKTIRTQRDLEFFLELPTLATLPSIGVNGDGNRRRTVFWKRRKAKPEEQTIEA